MTLYDISSDIFALNLALSFAVTFEGYPWVYMGDYPNTFVLLMGV